MKTIPFKIFLLLLCSCVHNKNSVDFLFEALEKRSPPDLIVAFKNAPLDSVVINNAKYNAIFVDTAKAIFRDPRVRNKFENYIEQNGLDLAGTQAKWAIIAAFHKKLNGEKYNINELLDQMIVLSNKIDEKKYGRVKYQ